MNNVASNRLNFSSFFTTEDIICNTEITQRDEIIQSLLELLALNRGIGNVKKAFKAVLEREETDSTVIADIAIPHARLKDISNLTVAVATSQQGIQFNGEKKKIHTVVLILVPYNQPSLYLQALSSLMSIFSKPETSKKLLQQNSPSDIYQFFDSGGIVLPEYVRASDIMITNVIKIRENASLKDAIDLFIKYNLVDLPIVDKDDDLVGVVAAQELLRVCLPDYILWMDDPSPILKFEPFANIMTNENQIWLTEIMSQNYAVAVESSPAMVVAQEMTKKNVSRAYVVRGKKLVGMITLQHFLKKVLRD